LRLGRRTHAAPKRGRIRKRRFAALLLVLVALSGAAFSFGLVTAIRSELAALDPSSPQRDVDTVIYSAPNASGQRRVLAILRGDESRVLVGSEAIAPIMKQAIVVVEDKRFYEHNGVDLRGIVRALWQDIRSQGVVEGGSTITQQYVKNAYSRNEQTIARKVREAALAWQLTQRWSKDRILTAYLNTVYFGNGAYGILQAARTYFRGKSAAELTLPDAALLAGIPQSPAQYDPVRHPAAARARRSFVLQQLYEQGRITRTEQRLADAAPMPKPENVRLPGTRGPAPYFVGYVTDQLVARYGAERVFGGGLEVTTTIDLDLQDRAREAIQKVLTQPGGPAAALVAIDPRTGAVRAMFGGTNFRRSQFNLATQAERQPGSSFKPIVLASAFRQGIAPSTRLVSKPVEIDAGDRIWKVSNYEGSYIGDVDLASAMVSSDNSVYAQLTKIVGPRSIVDTAHRLGIRSELPAYFSIGLGAVAVNPLDMTRAYATIANDGKRVDGSIMGNVPRVVQEVRFRKSGKS
jgi:penicillin-binding protein 1A